MITKQQLSASKDSIKHGKVKATNIEPPESDVKKHQQFIVCCDLLKINGSKRKWQICPI